MALRAAKRMALRAAKRTALRASIRIVLRAAIRMALRAGIRIVLRATTGDENLHRPDTIQPQDAILPYMLYRSCHVDSGRAIDSKNACPTP
jgi:hypothetical protein